MGLPVDYFKNFYILALVPMSALLYFAVLYIIGGIDKEDLNLLRQIIRRQPSENVVKSDNKSS
jgi:hypothetical protein